jgi:hypothetical protein
MKLKVLWFEWCVCWEVRICNEQRKDIKTFIKNLFDRSAIGDPLRNGHMFTLELSGWLIGESIDRVVEFERMAVLPRRPRPGLQTVGHRSVTAWRCCSSCLCRGLDSM